MIAAADPPQAQQLRARLVEQVAARTGASAEVLAALGRVPRHLFMPHVSLADAYHDGACPIGHGQTISQPTVVVMMTDALALEAGMRVLEVGTGSGYQTAMLAELGAEVFTVDIVKPLVNRTRKLLSQLGYENIRSEIRNGYEGWPEHAPYDAVIVTAAPPSIPDALVEQLADGGRLVAPIGARFRQQLVRQQKTGRGVEEEHLGAVAFVPMVRDGATQD